MLDVVWLKKDARVKDHGPLSEVLTKSTGPRFVLLYLYEPSQLRHHSCHGSHVAFANEGLAALEASLASLRLQAQKHEQLLTIRISEAVEALDALHQSEHGPVPRCPGGQ